MWEVLSVVCVVVVAAIGRLSVYVVVTGTYYKGVLGPALERDLGFKDEAVYLSAGLWPHSAVALLEPTR